MLSPLFWVSLAAVFIGLRWLADGLKSLLEVDFHKRSADDLSAAGEASTLDKAA